MGVATKHPKRDAKEAELDNDVSEGNSTCEYQNMTIANLKIELEYRGMAKGGRKADLVTRLIEYDNDMHDNYRRQLTRALPGVEMIVLDNDLGIGSYVQHIQSPHLSRDGLRWTAVPTWQGIQIPPGSPDSEELAVRQAITPASVTALVAPEVPKAMPTRITHSTSVPSKGFSEHSTAGATGQDIYKFMTASQLRQELGQRGMKKGGTKSQLIHRLVHGEDLFVGAHEEEEEEEICFDNTIDEDERRCRVMMGSPEPAQKLFKKAKAAKVAKPKPVKVGLYALNCDDLRSECRSRGLLLTGKKQDLIDALEEDDLDRAALAAEQALPGWKERVDENALASGEKRLDTFIPRPSGRYRGRVRKALSEKMFIISREKGVDDQGIICESFRMAGSKGHVYDVTIGRQSNCSCPDLIYNGGSQCKHIVYCLHIVLKASHELACQTALLACELQSIFANAPVTTEINFKLAEQAHPGVRKPLEGNDCPVCMFEFEPEEKVVWCKAACGQNIHEDCFMQWKKTNFDTVKCVYCRTPWIEGNTTAAEALLANAKDVRGWMNIAGSAAYDMAVAAEVGRYA